jgi:hypothetical protein
MPLGATRRVLLIGRYALKVPRLDTFRGALCANKWEREVWNVWQPIFGWQHICPVLFADPFGLLVVMPRCTQPVDQDVVDASIEDHYPEVNHESKADDHGYLQGRIVVVDYGLPLPKMVENERRRYDQVAAARGAS